MKNLSKTNKIAIIIGGIILLAVIGLLIGMSSCNSVDKKTKAITSTTTSAMEVTSTETTSEITSEAATTSALATSIVPTTTPQPQTTTDNTAALQQQIDQLQSEIEGLQEQVATSEPEPDPLADFTTFGLSISEEYQNITLRVGETKTIEVRVENCPNNSLIPNSLGSFCKTTRITSNSDIQVEQRVVFEIEANPNYVQLGNHTGRISFYSGNGVKEEVTVNITIVEE